MVVRRELFLRTTVALSLLRRFFRNRSQVSSVIFLRHPDPPSIGWLGVVALGVGFVGARRRSGWLFCVAYWLGGAGLLLFVLGLLVPSVLFLLCLFCTVGARCCCCVVEATMWHFFVWFVHLVCTTGRHLCCGIFSC